MLLLLFGIGGYIYGVLSSPRAWRASEVPVAFWAWRWHTPAAEEVAAAKDIARAERLFLRAGQIDYTTDRLELIRRVDGRMPADLPVDLVYNATPALLSRFESIEPARIASFISDEFVRQCYGAGGERLAIEGVQMDLDIPTRLLARYASMLKAVRERLPSGARLSITGLPTWMESSELRDVLRQIDYWIPQAYGARIAENEDEFVAITTPDQVAAVADGARRMGYPFYIGLPAYTYASLYSVSGKLVGLRGDTAPMELVTGSDFELLRRLSVPTGALHSRASSEERIGGYRYDFKARADTVVAGLTVSRGETLALSTMTPEGLRACAKEARMRAGERLLGICIFRLPASGDKSSLAIDQIAAALADREPGPLDFEIKTDRDSTGRQLRMSILPHGCIASIVGDEAVQLEMEVPEGSLRAIERLEGFTSAEAFHRVSKTGDGGPVTACTVRRANIVRVSAPIWVAGQALRVSLHSWGSWNGPIQAALKVRADDGRRVLASKREVNLGSK